MGIIQPTEMDESEADTVTGSGPGHAKNGLLDLPPELLCSIADQTGSERTINCLCRVSRYLYEVLNPYLYLHNARCRGRARCAIEWAAEHGAEETARKALAPRTFLGSPKPLHIAATKGYVRIVDMLLDMDGLQLEWRDNAKNTPLASAAVNGHAAMVKLLMDKGANPNPKYPLPTSSPLGAEDLAPSLILLTVAKGHTKVVKLLLDEGNADVNVRGSRNETPLTIAMKNGNADLVKFLIEAGANPNARTWTGEVPLLSPAREGRIDLVKILLAAPGIDPNLSDFRGNTPFILAAKWGNKSIIKLLMTTLGVDINKINADNRTALSHAVENGDVDMVRQLLSAEGPEVNASIPPLCEAAEHDCEKIAKPLLRTGRVSKTSIDEALAAAVRRRKNTLIEVLLELGADPCCHTGSNGYTPLMVACFNGNDTAAKLLLDTGKVDLEVSCKAGRSAFCHAAMNGRSTIVQLLLAAKKVDHINHLEEVTLESSLIASDRGNPLLAATMTGRVEVVKLLLEQENINPNVTDSHGKPPLSIAVADSAKVKIARLLLSHKDTDPNLKDNDGRSPLAHAVNFGPVEAVELLISVDGIDVNSKEDGGVPPLELAVLHRSKKKAKLLVAAEGIDIHQKNDDGKSAFDYEIREFAAALGVLKPS
ncbi:hypothetical protein AJ80_08839 [Polytolypa hystricis UAMH7299]|uniref:Uncharacterized protein n=1 Tax=Polytolypa hystricis (strain UAMH7299) TaxID=1447883 RepID=A0A2B7X1G0_POLH7|nr:hypothetical protein AJ80_08839 [Polytolypa hystricis UAMH7299]